MSLSLHTIKPKHGSKKRAKRIGRGLAKKGTTAGRGTKGQRARSGGKSGLQLKGIRKIMLSVPKKKGFTSKRPAPATVNLGAINKNFKDGAHVTPKSLLAAGLIAETKNGVKILGDGQLGIKVSVRGCKISENAKQKIEKAGGTIA